MMIDNKNRKKVRHFEANIPAPAAGRSLAAGKKQPRLIEVKVRYTFGVYRAVIAPSEDDTQPWSRKNHKQHAPHDWVIVRWIDVPPMMDSNQ